MIKKYPLISFVTLAYGITWLSTLPLTISGIQETEILVLFGLFGPVLSAYFVTRSINPGPPVDRDPWFWWVFLGVFITGTLVYTFEVKLPVEVTRKALEDAVNGRDLASFSTVDELFEDLGI